MLNLIDRHKGYLFSSADLSQIIARARANLATEVDRLDGNQLLNTSPTDLATYLVEKFRIEPPKMRRDKWVAGETETQIDVSQDSRRGIVDRSRPIYIAGQLIEIEVPVEGDIELLYARASTFTYSPPRAKIKGTSIILRFEIAHDSENFDLKQRAESILSEIEQHITWIRNDLSSYNLNLTAVANSAISARRDRLLANQGRVSSLGIPLKQRSNIPSTYAPPEVRRKVSPVFPTASHATFVPEPALDMVNYEHILSVIQNMSQVIERSPSAFRSMGEEDIRQHFLVQLNGHFEGAATGETFNMGGKTDILLRANDRNVFIAECKFWKGSKQFGETITQLLSYTAWRDTKTAILVFNRDTAVSTVLAGIATETKNHPQYKRDVNWSHESGFRYILHSPNDTNREVMLTVLVFDLPSNKKTNLKD